MKNKNIWPMKLIINKHQVSLRKPTFKRLNIGPKPRSLLSMGDWTGGGVRPLQCLRHKTSLSTSQLQRKQKNIDVTVKLMTAFNFDIKVAWITTALFIATKVTLTLFLFQICKSETRFVLYLLDSLLIALNDPYYWFFFFEPISYVIILMFLSDFHALNCTFCDSFHFRE